METITGRNVNDIFPIGLMMLREQGVPLPSRNGPVLEVPEPVSVMYVKPCERVLFDKKRAINPFLHFFEPLWILAGQDDVATLSNIVPRFKEYSDNGVNFYGAYGKRMMFPVNQLYLAIEALKKNPDDRRVVIQIRHPQDIGYEGKDQPCNISIALKIRNGKLNIHVFNRSNDYIWGMLGANAVQFSSVQEYIAAKIGVPVGMYHQTTDSMHDYTENPQWDLLKDTDVWVNCPYRADRVQPFPMINGSTDADAFDMDLDRFFDGGERTGFNSDYFKYVVTPMWDTFMMHKLNKNGLSRVNSIEASDWRLVTTNWLKERENV